MRKLLLFLMMVGICFSCATAESTSFVGQRISVSNTPYTLVIFWPEGEEAPAHRALFEELYFACYPVMREVYGTTDATEVTIFFHHAPDSIAYTDGQSIFVSIEYMDAHPEDYNLLTHELFHVVQNGYAGDDPFIPVLTEGLADYARAQYGYRQDDNWVLSSWQEGQSYMDSYRVTGGFLNWISQRYGERTIIRLNRTLHEGRYTADVWQNYTGQTLDALWAEYALAEK